MIRASKFSFAIGLLVVVSTAIPNAKAATSKPAKTKVKLCQKDVDRLCSNADKKGIPNCLFSPENRKQLSPSCRQELDARRKKTLTACKAVAELVCKKEMQSGALIAPCLYERVEDPGFPEECRARLDQIPNETPLGNNF